MNGKDVIRKQIELFYMMAHANLEGVDAELAMRQPAAEGNCINWIVGHATGVHNALMDLVGETPVWESPALERVRTEPVTTADEALPWDEMVAALLGSQERCLAGLDRLTEEDLAEGGFDGPFGDVVTRGEFLTIIAVHQIYHAGQLGLARRLVGLPGAIRAPEPQTSAS